MNKLEHVYTDMFSCFFSLLLSEIKPIFPLDLIPLLFNYFDHYFVHNALSHYYVVRLEKIQKKNESVEFYCVIFNQQSEQ